MEQVVTTNEPNSVMPDEVTPVAPVIQAPYDAAAMARELQELMASENSQRHVFLGDTATLAFDELENVFFSEPSRQSRLPPPPPPPPPPRAPLKKDSPPVFLSCAECNKLIAERNMKSHMRTMHQPKQFTCPECDKTYPRKQGLDQHYNCTHADQTDPRVIAKKVALKDAQIAQRVKRKRFQDL
ncbi:hypothetical protein T484DRAFT_1754958 [Baffinella frigidus]|nr:hypothetical protein T484DRAFT_1754958 [Cryptophyta sp. CCMP2293]